MGGGDEVLWAADALVAAGDGPDPAEDGDGGGGLEAVDVDELTKLDLVAADEVVLLVR